MFLKQKKGAEKQFYMMAELLFAAVVILAFFFFVSSKISDTTLEKNYVARDIALLMEAIYAAPGQLEYTYPVGYDFSIRIAASGITVWDDKGNAHYWYSHDNAVVHEPGEFVFAFKGNKKEIKFIKKNEQLLITCSGCSRTALK